MAETRCANPEYQLDVDVMMVEYTLYRTIEAQLKLLKSMAQNEDGFGFTDTQDTAAGLLENFDILLRLFRRNHVHTPLSEGTEFSIKILEYLVLFSDWLRLAPNLALGRRHHNVSNWSGFEDEHVVNALLRRQWLLTFPHAFKDVSTAIKFTSSSVNATGASRHPFGLVDVLPRFLDLSAETASCMGAVNVNWYKLAAEHMLQCALEWMEIYAEEEVDDDTSIIPTDRLMRLSQCFAWGIAPRVPADGPSACDLLRVVTPTVEDTTLQTLERAVPIELHISKMFTSSPEGEDDSEIDENRMAGIADEPTENPQWTETRSVYYIKAYKCFQKMTQANTIDQKVAAAASLRALHPRDEFTASLLSFVEGLWCLNMNTISGKPVLVQIEEGSIEGMDEDEFKAFLERVGLTAGRKEREGTFHVRWMM